jgi:hypothetical protein
MNMMLRLLAGLMLILALAAPAQATRKEGVVGTVDKVTSHSVTIANKTYRIGRDFRVVVITKSGVSRFQTAGRLSDLRVGDKVSAVVLYDEVVDIFLERY